MGMKKGRKKGTANDPIEKAIGSRGKPVIMLWKVQ